MSTKINIPAGGVHPTGFVRVGVNGRITFLQRGRDINVEDDVLEVLNNDRVPYAFVPASLTPNGQIIIPSSTGFSGDIGVNGLITRVPLDVAFTPTIAVFEALNNARAPFNLVYSADASTAPAAPSFAVTAGIAQNTITWTDGNNGGSPITGHKLYRSTTSGFTPGPGNLVGTITTASPYVDTGLTNGVTYYYRLSAENAIGGTLAAQKSGTPQAGLALTGDPTPAKVGTAYSFTFGATGAVGALTWSVLQGSLAPGETFNSNGSITGTPTGV